MNHNCSSIAFVDIFDFFAYNESRENPTFIIFIVEGNTVRIVNSAVYAMQMLQSEMEGEAE